MKLVEQGCCDVEVSSDGCEEDEVGKEGEDV